MLGRRDFLAGALASGSLLAPFGARAQRPLIGGEHAQPLWSVRLSSQELGMELFIIQRLSIRSLQPDEPNCAKQARDCKQHQQH